MKIVIVNAHWYNRGDEAALSPILRVLSGTNNDVNIVFKEKVPVKEIVGFENINIHTIRFLPESCEQIKRCINNVCDGIDDVRDENEGSMAEMIKLLKSADLIIYSPGGSVICNRFWWTKQLEYLLPFICAKEFGVKMMVAAPSMGPFFKEQRETLNLYLKSSEKICVREELSRNYLNEIGISENVLVTIDTAFYDDPDLKDNEQKLNSYSQLNDFLKKYKKIIGMTITDFKWNVGINSDEDLVENRKNIIKNCISRLKEEGIGVLLIPQLFDAQNDKKYLEIFSDENVFILSDEYDTYFQQFIISKLYAVIGMRYHSNIFAAKMGTPFIAISYEEKMYGFMNKYGFNKYCIKLEDLSENILFQKINLLDSQYEEIKNNLAEYRAEWRKLAGMTIESIVKMI